MNEFKGTPGPWLLMGSTIYKLNECRHPSNHFYATLQRGVGSDGRYISDFEILANANLIVAAPDLLEALQNAVHGCENNHPLDADISSWLPAARAAIAKALGESGQ